MLQNSMDAELLDMKNFDLEDIRKKKNENPDLNMRCRERRCCYHTDL